jgi:hypothetical protein
MYLSNANLIAETYNGPQGTKHAYSRNLEEISSPTSAPYMEELLSSPFFAYKTPPYGKKNRLFAALQIVLSHLVLHPNSEFAAMAKDSRDNYDVRIVYLYDVPLKSIYQRQASEPEQLETQHKDFKLGLDELLHIRNFWRAHLATKVTKVYAQVGITYENMARTLVERKHAPRQWDRPIQESSEVLPHWFGHYSCIHATPRKIVDLEEHQTCAQDWIGQHGDNGVHPLTLDIATTALLQRGWWPPIFATMPILESTVPHAGAGSGHVYIRGIAPFLAPPNNPDLYPAYTALRVRGVIHPIPDQQEIPGWRRIIMVLYQPTSRYLLAVLDENSPDEDENNPFSQIEPLADLQAQNLSSNQNGGGGQAVAQDLLHVVEQGQPQEQAQTQAQAQAVAANSEETEETMRKELEARAELKAPLGPAYLKRDFIANMEDNLHPPEELAWEDLSYAWVYEGIIIPGGRIMMGRYWRCGPPSTVLGFELGDGIDRGPWVFWC